MKFLERLFGAPKPVAVANHTISIKTSREEKPEFERVYTAQVNSRVSLEVTMKWFIGSRRDASGILNQTGGKWVTFDPENPADRILDRDILPIVRGLCDTIFTLDAAYVKSDPSEFVDKAGNRWKRVP